LNVAKTLCEKSRSAQGSPYEGRTPSALLTNDDIGYISKEPYAQAFSKTDNIKSFSVAGIVPFTRRPLHEQLARESKQRAAQQIAQGETGLDFSALSPVLIGVAAQNRAGPSSQLQAGSSTDTVTQEPQTTQGTDDGESMKRRRLGKGSSVWGGGPMTRTEIVDALNAKEKLKAAKEEQKQEKARIRQEKVEQARLEAVKSVEELKALVLEQGNWQMRPEGMLYRKHVQSVFTLLGTKGPKESISEVINVAKKILKWSEETRSFAEPPIVSTLAPLRIISAWCSILH
jgi:hypothetical protein